MKSFFIRDLVPNQVMTSTFLVHTKTIRQKKSGEPYLSLLLGDRTGEIDAKMWDNVAEVMETFERDDFVKVKGLLQIFQNRPQLTIHKMMRLSGSDVEAADYFPCSKRNPNEMFAELRGIIAGIQNAHLRTLLDAFMDDESIAKPYRTAPAAKSVHHAFLGGLLEHVLSVCRLGRLMASHYEDIDLDLLLTGAILHDVGKVSELTYERTFGYSTDGQLLGHIYIGLQMLNQKLGKFPEFPLKLRILLEHMILSHHGELEYGSPKVPLFPEALLLHHLDNLDSKMECMRSAVAKDRNVEGCWTTFNSALERNVLKKSRYVEDAIPEATAAPPEPDHKTAEPISVTAPAPPVHETNGHAPDPKPPTSAEQSHAQITTPAEQGVSVFAQKLQQAWRR